MADLPPPPPSRGRLWAYRLRRVAEPWLDPAVTACASLALLLWTLPPVGPRPWILAALHVAMAAITFSVLESRRRAAVREPVEGFWRDIMAALGLWMLVDASMAAAEGAAYLGAGAFLRIFGVLAWVAIWLAAARNPHRRGHWRPRRVERRLHVAGAAAVTLGATSYVVLPQVWAGGFEGAARQTWLLLAVFALMVVMRLGVAVAKADSARWRGVYRSLMAATVMAGVGHVFAVMEPMPEASVTLGGPWAALAMTFLTLCGRLDQLHGDDETAQALGDPVEEGPQQLETPYLAFAIALPLIHYGASRMGWLIEGLDPARERVMIVWAMSLASVSVYQQRRLERWTRKTLDERSRLGRSLQASRRRLQLAEERQQMEDVMRRSREVYGKAFRDSYWSVALTTRDGGRHLECNDRYLETIGYSRDRVLGSTTLDLGLWADTAARDRMLELLARDGYVRGFEMHFRRGDGELRPALLSIVPVEIDGEACLLSVSRDVADLHAAEHRRARVDRLVSGLPHPVWHLDLTDRVLSMNDAAVDIVGAVDGDPGPVLTELEGLVDPGAWRRATRRATERGSFEGPLRYRRDGVELHADAVMTLVRDYYGLPSGKLIFLDTAGESNGLGSG
ncbi:MAG: PAS domain S-box protein [Acidobacteriota bacterium]